MARPNGWCSAGSVSHKASQCQTAVCSSVLHQCTLCSSRCVQENASTVYKHMCTGNWVPYLGNGYSVEGSLQAPDACLMYGGTPWTSDFHFPILVSKNVIVV